MGILRLSVQAYRETTKIRGKGLGPKPRLFLFLRLQDWNDTGQPEAGGPEGSLQRMTLPSLLFKVQQ